MPSTEQAASRPQSSVQYTVDRKPVDRAAALAAWLARDPEGDRSFIIFDKAHEATSMGYVAREYLEQEGITLRHRYEEQVQ